MKMVSRITAIGLAGVAICYLGLSGYVWYHDNKRSKQADVQALYSWRETVDGLRH